MVAGNVMQEDVINGHTPNKIERTYGILKVSLQFLEMLDRVIASMTLAQAVHCFFKPDSADWGK